MKFRTLKIVSDKIAIIVILMTLAICTCCLTGCTGNTYNKKNVSEADVHERDVFAMDTYMSLKVYGNNADTALKEASDYIYKLSSLLDVNESDSEIYKLNTHLMSCAVSDDTFDIISESSKYSQMTYGKFDPTVYPLVRAWGFTTQEHKIPAQSEIDNLLPHVGMDKLTLNSDNHCIIMNDLYTEIDTGAIAKGYLSQKIYEIFQKNEIQSAIVSLGGNVLAMGSKPDKSDWKIAISNPSDPDTNIATVQTHDKFIVTSGSYQRYFTKNGKRYHHIINPETGKPADNGIVSVTIVSDNGTAADALSTALFVMGRKEAVKFWKKSPLPFDLILIDNEDNIYITEGIENSFETKSKKLHIIRENSN